MEVGFAKSIRSFLIHVDGLPSVKINDMVENEAGLRGWVRALYEDRVEVLLLDEGDVRKGQVFRNVGKTLSVSAGNFLLGRAINPLGVPIDGKGLFAKSKVEVNLHLDPTPAGINAREFIEDQFITGVSMIDTLVPIGKGQRELILGDARSGKTSLLIDIIINQKKSNVICIYAAIGKPVAEVRNLIDVLKANHALSYTIVVASSSADSPPLIFLTPQTAMTLAEFFQKQGKDVLIILDDMGNHAKIYREIALLSNRTPGRESYPGDIFYQQAHILERAGNFVKILGGGSITALPIIEINLNDFTTYVPTNLMAMTDGHLLIRSSLFTRGQRPAVDLSLSVSRVGQQTQTSIQNSLSTKIKQILAAGAQLETVSRFSFELPPETQLILKQQDLLLHLLRQAPLTFYPPEYQVILLSLPFTSFVQNGQSSPASRAKTAADVELLMKKPGFVNLAANVLKIKTLDTLFAEVEKIL